MFPFELYKLDAREIAKGMEEGGKEKRKYHLDEFFFSPTRGGMHPPFETLHTRKSLKTGRDSSAHYRAILRERSRGMIGERNE